MDRDKLDALSKHKLEIMAEDMGLDVAGMKKSEIVDAILAQSADTDEVPVPKATEPKREIAPPPAETAPPPAPDPGAPKFYQVAKAGRYAVDGFCHSVPAGMLVSDQTHNVPLMLSQGVALVAVSNPTTQDIHRSPGRLGQLRALAGTAPEAAMDAFGGEAAAYYAVGPNGERLPVEQVAVAPNISILATLK